MGLLNKLLKPFNIKQLEQPTESPFGSFDSLLRGVPRITKDTSALVVSWSFACMEKRAKLVADTELYFWQQSQDGYEIINNHPFQRLLESPNSVFNQTFKDILYLIQTRLDYYGNAYIWARPSANGKDIIDLLPIMTNDVKIIASNSKYNSEYEFRIGSTTVKINGDEIIHFRTVGIPNDNSFANNHFLGTPKIINSIKDVLTSHQELTDYTKSYFENDTVQPMAYESPASLSDSQWVRFKQTFYDAFGASTKKPKILLSENGGKFTTLGSKENVVNPSVFKEGLDNNLANQICIAFETPKTLLENNFKYAESKEYLQTYKKDVIKPLSNYIAETFQSHFKKYYTDTIFESKELDFISESNKLTYINLLVQHNAITKNELRELAGYNPLTDDQVQGIDTETESVKSLDINSNEGIIKDYWKKYDDVSESFADDYKSKVANFYDMLKSEIIKNITETSSKNIKAEINEGVELFTIDTWTKILQGITATSLNPFLNEIMGLALNDIDSDIDSYTLTEQQIQAVTNEINNLMVDPVETVDREIKENIKKIIQESPNDSPDVRLFKINNMVSDRFDSIYKGSRSEMIARTTATASSESLKDKVFTTGGFDKVWISSRDAKVRDSHKKADKQVAKNGYFEIANKKARYPSDSSLPPEESINCRCRTAARKKDKIYINGVEWKIK